MAEDLTITYFDITDLGFHNPTQELDLNSTIDQVQRWVRNQGNISNTKVIERIANSQNLPLYCHSIRNINRNRTFFTMWNETSSYKGAIASLPMNGQIGTATAAKTRIPNNSIPGYPSYFMILHNEKVLLNIKRENETASTRKFTDYIEKFLRRFSRHVVFENDPDGNIFDREISHYLLTEEDENEIKSPPYFRASQSYNDTEEDDLLNKVDRIYKLVYSHDINYDIAVSEEGFLRDLLTDIGIRNPRYNQEYVKFKTEIDYEPTVTDLRQIIAKWRRSIQQNEDLRQGFRLRGESDKVLWLDKMIKRRKINTVIESDNVIVTDELIQKIGGMRFE